jgi:hypothetical protein
MTGRLEAVFLPKQTHLHRFDPKNQIDLNSHHLHEYFKKKGINPMTNYCDLYETAQQAQIMLTVDWNTSFSEIRGCLNKENIKHQRRYPTSQVQYTIQRMFCLELCSDPSSLPEEIESCRVWIDVLFNNPKAKLEQRLSRAQRNCMHAELHLAIASDRLLTRAQCLFEIGSRLSYGKSATIIHNWTKIPVCLVSIRSCFWNMKGSDDGTDPEHPYRQENVRMIQDAILSAWHPDGATQLQQHSVVKKFDNDLLCFVRESNDLNSPTSIPSRLCEWLALWIFAPIVFSLIFFRFVSGLRQKHCVVAPASETEPEEHPDSSVANEAD